MSQRTELKEFEKLFLPEFGKAGPLKSANQTLTRDAWRLGHLSSDFNDRPERLAGVGGRFRRPPGFEIKLQSLAQVRPGGFHVLTLGSDVELRAASDVSVVFFGDERREATGHS